MPTGKVKWYDAEKGFGFLSQEDGPDVYVRAEALPEGTDALKAGTRVEFGIAQGRRATRRCRCGSSTAPASVSRNQRDAKRKKPDEMATIVEDLIRLLDGVGEAYRHGRHPDRKRRPSRVAKLLRALADELELEPSSRRRRDLCSRATPVGAGADRRTNADHGASTDGRDTPRPSAAGRAASRCRRTRRSPRPAGGWCRCGAKALACTRCGTSRWMVASRENFASACASPATRPSSASASTP